MSADEQGVTPLLPEIAELLEAEGRRPGPTPAMRRDLYARIATTIGLAPGEPPPGDDGPGGAPAGGEDGGASPSDGAELAAGSAAAGSAGTMAKLVAVIVKPATIAAFVAGAAAGGATVGVLVRPTPPPAAHVQRAAPVARPVGVALPGDAARQRAPADAAVASTPDLAPHPTAAPATPRPRAARAGGGSRVRQGSPPPHAAADEQLAAERAVIEVARTALARGLGKDALATLDQHRRKFATGRLSEEREALAILALLDLGRQEQAGRRVRAFRRTYPQSLLLPTIDAALAKAKAASQPK